MRWCYRCGGADIYCPDCKLSVTRRQVDLAWAWMRRMKAMKEAAQ